MSVQDYVDYFSNNYKTTGKSVVDPAFANTLKEWSIAHVLTLSESTSIPALRKAVSMFYESKSGDKRDAYEKSISIPESELEILRKNLVITEDSKIEKVPEHTDDETDLPTPKEDSDVVKTETEDEKSDQPKEHTVSVYSSELKRYIESGIPKLGKVTQGAIDSAKKILEASSPNPDSIEDKNPECINVVDIMIPLVAAVMNNKDIQKKVEEYLKGSSYTPNIASPSFQGVDVEIFEDTEIDLKRYLKESSNAIDSAVEDGWHYASNEEVLVPIKELRKHIPSKFKMMYVKGKGIHVIQGNNHVRTIKLYKAPGTSVDKVRQFMEAATKADPVTTASRAAIEKMAREIAKESPLSPAELKDVIDFSDEIGLTKKESMNALIKCAVSASKAKKGSREEYAKDVILMQNLSTKEDKSVMDKFYAALKGDKKTDKPDSGTEVKPEETKSPVVTDLNPKNEMPEVEKDVEKVDGQLRGTSNIDESAIVRADAIINLSETKIVKLDDGRHVKVRRDDAALLKKYIEESISVEKRKTAKLSLIDSYDGFQFVYNQAFENQKCR